MTNDIYLRVDEVAHKLGIGVSTVWRWASKKEKLDKGFPKPRRLSTRVTVFSNKELENFMNKHLER